MFFIVLPLICPTDSLKYFVAVEASHNNKEFQELLYEGVQFYFYKVFIGGNVVEHIVIVLLPI